MIRKCHQIFQLNLINAYLQHERDQANLYPKFAKRILRPKQKSQITSLDLFEEAKQSIYITRKFEHLFEQQRYAYDLSYTLATSFW